MRFRAKGSYLSRLDSTAMADIIFNLLIFFLLSSSFIMESGLSLQLPKAVQPSTLSARDVVVTLAPNEELFVNDRRIGWPALETELAQALERSSGKQVVVRGDEAVSLGRVVTVMDAARRLGAQQLAIAARPFKAEGEAQRGPH